MHFRNITQNRIKLLVYLNDMHIVQAFVWGGGVSQGGGVGWRSAALPPSLQNEALVLHTFNNGFKQKSQPYPPILCFLDP